MGYEAEEVSIRKGSIRGGHCVIVTVECRRFLHMSFVKMTLVFRAGIRIDAVDLDNRRTLRQIGSNNNLKLVKRSTTRRKKCWRRTGTVISSLTS
jgi:hypothetical protein